MSKKSDQHGKKAKRRLRLALILLTTFALYCSILLLLVEVERGASGTTVLNFGDAFWYAFVTLTTLGYGDVLPVTLAGKFIGSIFILLSVFLLSIAVGKIADLFQQYREKKRMGHYGASRDFVNHVIIIGWDSFAKMITEQLFKSGNKVAVVTDRKEDIDLLEDAFEQEKSSGSFFALFSNLNNYETFSKINIKDSKVIFVNLATDTEKLVYLINIRAIHPDLKFLVTLDEGNLKNTFISAGVTYCLSKNEITSKLIASFIFEPNVALYTTDLLDSAEAGNADDYDIQEFTVVEGNPYLNKTYGEAFFDIKNKYNSALIGLSKLEDGVYNLKKLPSDEEMIRLGDVIIVINNGYSNERMESAFRTKQGL
ncbi:MAG: potassium channel family protein [Chloroflexota bacterium]